MKNNKVILSTVAIAAAFSFAATNAQVADASATKEKCYGVGIKGLNDCAALDKSHSCQGQSTEDASLKEWVYVGKGICGKLVNGHLAEDVMKKAEAMKMLLEKQ